MHKPRGLRRGKSIQCKINFRDTDGLKAARKLEAIGLVTVKFIKAYTQQYNPRTKMEYWAEYEIEPTPAGLLLLDTYDAYRDDLIIKEI